MKFLFGKNDTLFLDNDSNGVIGQTMGKITLPSDVLETIWRHHKSRKLTLNSSGSDYFHIVAPNKETVLRDHLPDGILYEEHGPTPMSCYAREFGTVGSGSYDPLFDEVTYFKPDLLRDCVRVGQPTYPRTDTHWTRQAARAYFGAFLGWAGLELEQRCLVDLPYKEQQITFLGDLGVLAGVQGEQVAQLRVAPNRHVSVFDNKVGNEGRIRHTKNHAPNVINKKLLIIHDSFINSLVIMISEVFREVLYIHTQNIDFSFIQHFKPQITLSIQVERFFGPRISNNVSYIDWLQSMSAVKYVDPASLKYIQSLYSA